MDKLKKLKKKRVIKVPANVNDGFIYLYKGIFLKDYYDLCVKVLGK